MPDPMDNPELIAAAADFCLAESPSNTQSPYVCTEEPGHDGWHRVELDGELLDTWPTEAP